MVCLTFWDIQSQTTISGPAMVTSDWESPVKQQEVKLDLEAEGYITVLTRLRVRMKKTEHWAPSAGPHCSQTATILTTSEASLEARRGRREFIGMRRSRLRRGAHLLARCEAQRQYGPYIGCCALEERHLIVVGPEEAEELQRAA